ncbi:hypothetical protein G6F40_015897 [Rhizopus arrhizus]|nr:hypothetical protein G6F40_015897 [Rhizopus arrhizus]
MKGANAASALSRSAAARASGIERSARPSGPNWPTYVGRSSRAIEQGRSTATTSTSFQPAASNTCRTRSPSAKANCPGAPGTRGGSSSASPMARSAVVMNGFSSAPRQAMKRRPAPGSAARCRLAKAAPVSSKNITPSRDWIQS